MSTLPSSRTALLQEIFSTATLMKRLMHTQFYRVLEKGDLAPSQLQLLTFIEHAQPTHLKKLAEKMHLTPGAITQLIEGLVVNDYVARTQDEHDRRITRITLTAKGSQRIAQHKKQHEALFTEAVSTLDTRELEVFLRVQQKMLERLEANAVHTEAKK